MALKALGFQAGNHGKIVRPEDHYMPRVWPKMALGCICCINIQVYHSYHFPGSLMPYEEAVVIATEQL